MDKIYELKNLFHKKVDYSLPNPNEQFDISLLCDMGREMKKVYASNKRQYIYYVLRDEDHIDIAYYLFRRNGIHVSEHISRMYYAPTFVLRVPVKDLLKNAERRKFVESIMSGRLGLRRNVTDVQTRLDIVSEQMKQKRR